MSEFVWADLSTYHPKDSIEFYQKVFGWQFHNSGGYHVAVQGSAEIAGLFETPEFFKKIKMPHFWMSYIAVEDAIKTAELAAKFEKAKVELTDEFYGGKIALIRDPQGAGFTVYDGGKLHSSKVAPNGLIWNELHVSDVSKVLPFYSELLGWNIKPTEFPGQFRVINSQAKHIADISEIPNDLKGKYEYWVCTFAVKDIETTSQTILKSGGGIVSNEGTRLLVHDDSGEAFFYIQDAHAE